MKFKAGQILQSKQDVNKYCLCCLLLEKINEKSWKVITWFKGENKFLFLEAWEEDLKSFYEILIDV